MPLEVGWFGQSINGSFLLADLYDPVLAPQPHRIHPMVHQALALLGKPQRPLTGKLEPKFSNQQANFSIFFLRFSEHVYVFSRKSCAKLLPVFGEVPWAPGSDFGPSPRRSILRARVTIQTAKTSYFKHFQTSHWIIIINLAAVLFPFWNIMPDNKPAKPPKCSVELPCCDLKRLWNNTLPQLLWTATPLEMKPKSLAGGRSQALGRLDIPLFELNVNTMKLTGTLELNTNIPPKVNVRSERCQADKNRRGLQIIFLSCTFFVHTHTEFALRMCFALIV